ncbi:hypothetical protein JOS77_08455 [Chromobacterium haemolyticum]|nr:hypothetical protein JOS77_08455 [Chromobacterium haemolyticum]
MADMPGLAAVYHRLAAAALELRPNPASLPPAEAGVERAIQAALSRPEHAVTLPPLSRPPQPVLLWLHPEPPLTDADGQASPHAATANAAAARTPSASAAAIAPGAWNRTSARTAC